MSELIVLNDSQPNRADAIKNRALLLDTARRLFVEQGVEAVSMTAIAEAAEVGKGTLYRHFENKALLCEALLDDDQRDLQSRTLLKLRPPNEPVETLIWFLGEVVAFVERNLNLLCVSTRPGEASLQFPAHLWWRQTVRALLEQAHAPGDLDYSADVLYVMLDVHTIRFQRSFLGYETSRIISGLTDVLQALLK